MRALLLLICSILIGKIMAAEEKIVYGYVEKATLMEKGLVLSAKLDTGAKSASLSAIHIREIERNGKHFLTFNVPCKQGNVRFIAEYLGKVKIKVRAGEYKHINPQKEPIKRPVVLMRVKIGELEKEIAINLTNRKRFIYPLLLGRDAIKAFSGLVDPGTAFKLRKNQG